MKVAFGTIALFFTSASLVQASKYGRERKAKKDGEKEGRKTGRAVRSVQIGDRPFWLINQMPEGPLKEELSKYGSVVLQRSHFLSCLFSYVQQQIY